MHNSKKGNLSVCIVPCKGSSWGWKPALSLPSWGTDSIGTGSMRTGQVSGQDGRQCVATSSVTSCPDFYVLLSTWQNTRLPADQTWKTCEEELATCLFWGRGVMKPRPHSHYRAKDVSEPHPRLCLANAGLQVWTTHCTSLVLCRQEEDYGILWSGHQGLYVLEILM